MVVSLGPAMPRRAGPDGRLVGLLRESRGGSGAVCLGRWVGGLALITLVIHLNTSVLVSLRGGACPPDTGE